MAEQPEFQRKQYAFAAHIRDPERVPAPEGIEDRRMAVYRELFFNNLKSLLSTTFPVLKKLHGDDHWRRLVRSFMKHHRAETPYFLELPGEFLSFLREEYQRSDDDFPFLVELAHYEYVELALSIATEEIVETGIDRDGDLLDQVPVKSPLAWVYAYRYPVHRISADFLPDAPLDQPVYIAVYRQRNDEVGFMELNPVTAALLDALESNDAGEPGRRLLEDLARRIDYADVSAFLAHGLSALEEMRRQDIVLGTRSSRRGSA